MKTTRLSSKILALALALTMIAGLTPITANGTGTVIDVSTAAVGTVVTTGDGWTRNDHVYTILDGANVTVTGSITGTGAQLNYISVAEGAKVNITLNGVSITDTRETGSISAGLELLPGADVTLTLAAGTQNKFDMYQQPGIFVPEGAKLTIKGEGSLTAKTTGDAAFTDTGPAAIGGSLTAANSGTIIIESGTIIAEGWLGAAIGAGAGGIASEIIISGGMVLAEKTDSTAAVIGGAGNSTSGTTNGGNITISGDAVVMTSRDNDGVGIGGGTATVSISGNAVVSTNSISDTNTLTRTGGILFTGGNALLGERTGEVLGSTVTLGTDIHTPETYTLNIATGKTLTVATGVTLTNGGTINNDGTITNKGAIDGAIYGTGKIVNNGIVNCYTGDIDVLTWSGDKANLLADITFPTASDVTWPLPLSNSTLSFSSNDYGSFAWENPDDVPAASGTYDYDVVFIPTRDDIYDTITGKVAVTYNKTEVTITGEVEDKTDDGTLTVTSGPTPETPPATDTIPGSAAGTDETTDVSVTVDNDTGSVTVNLDAETTDALIEKAIEAASVERGDPDAPAPVPTVTLDLSSIENATTAALNVEAAQSFSDAEVAVTVILPDAEITLAPEALAALAALAVAGNGTTPGPDGPPPSPEGGNGTTPITVEASEVPMSELQGMQAAQVKGYETVVSIDVFVGSTKVDVPLTVSLPYTLKANENPAGVTVWHLDDNGTLTKLTGVYNAATGMITFTINHQSFFVVGYDPVALWVNVFTDVSAGAWYYDAISFANYHGLLRGVGDSRFAPQDSMTRAMFVQVLANLEGQPPPSADGTPFDTKGAGDEEAPFAHEGGAPQGRGLFSDVAETAWYYNAVTWAASNGIVSGVGGGNNFAPDNAVTRQEMAVMLYSYANFKGIDIPAHRAMPTFTDQASISSWAETAAKALSEAGVLSGSNNEFAPQRFATRAEVATMFRNFMRLVLPDNESR